MFSFTRLVQNQAIAPDPVAGTATGIVPVFALVLEPVLRWEIAPALVAAPERRWHHRSKMRRAKPEPGWFFF